MARNNPALDKVLRDFAEAERSMAPLLQKLERHYRSYRGLIDRRSEAAGWTSKHHPAYVNQIVETMVSSTVDPRLRFKVRPRPKAISPEEGRALLKGARTTERVLAFELETDRFDEKQRPFILQGFIGGWSVGRTLWNSKDGVRKSLQYADRPVHGPDGFEIGRIPVLQEFEQDEYEVDDPSFQVVDARDFFWPEGSPSLDEAKYVVHRSWVTFEDLKDLEQAGVFSNVDQVKDSRDFSDELSTREMETLSVSRTKGRIELLERWTNKGVISVANRKVVLRDGENPFWHGQKPFIVSSGQPDLFQIQGMSVVEICAPLQEMLWTLGNQRLDNLRLLNNAIILIRSDVDDPDAFEWVPGAQWMVDDVNQVKQLDINPEVTQLSLEAEKLIKGDLQNLTGGAPFLSGAQSQTMDQSTATGVSIVTTLAQRMVEARKFQFQLGFQRVGQQFVSLLQQFMREPRLIRIAGADGEDDFLQVHPHEIQGRLDVSIEISNESMMRQERRAEAQAKLQMAGQLAPVFAAVGSPLNLQAFMEDFLDSYDVDDKERYFSAQQQQLGAPGGPGAQQPPGEPQGPGGVTSPLATAPTSPSNQTSISPEVFLARARAMTGGASNA